MSEFSGKMSMQEKIRSGLIKTPIKKLNKYFNYSYIFGPPTPKELAEMQSKVDKALKTKAKWLDHSILEAVLNKLAIHPYNIYCFQ